MNYFDTQFLRDAAVAQTNYFTNGVADMLDALLSARSITQPEYDARLLGNSAALVDVTSKGVEFVANPSKHWTVRLGYSYSDRFRDNYFLEREPYWSEFRPSPPAFSAPTGSLDTGGKRRG